MQTPSGVLLSRDGVVLIVEDDASLRELYSAALRFAGFKICLASDGIEALHRLEDAPPPDAVVLDLGLPRLNGLTVAEELVAHSETRDIPIVVVTGETQPLNEQAFAAVIRKPAGPEQVVAAVEDSLRSRPSRRTPPAAHGTLGAS